MKRQLFFITAISCTLSATAQIHVWTKGLIGANNTELYGRGIHVETSGNAIYSHGEHSNFEAANTFYIDPVGQNIPVTGGISSGYVTKMNPNGQLIWAHTFVSTSWTRVTDVHSDPGGNCYITGFFLGTMDADPGNSVQNLTSNSAQTSFLVKLDASGNFIWAQQYDGIFIHTVEIRSNAVFCGGFFSGQCDFDGSAATHSLTSQDNMDCFVMRLNTEGELQWVKAFGSSANSSGLMESVISINLTPNGKINVAGVFSEAGDFNPDAGETLLTSTGESDVFILQLDAMGTFQWGVNAGSNHGVLGAQIATTATGAIYQTNTIVVSTTNEPREDISIRKFTSNGTLLWSKQIGGNRMEQAIGITTDQEENAYISGDFGSESIDFDPGQEEKILQCNSMELMNGYLLKLTTDGNLEWVTSLLGNTNSIADVKYNGGFLYTTGCFFNYLDFAPGEDYYYGIVANPPYPSSFVSKIDATETLDLTEVLLENNKLFTLYPNPAQSATTIQTEQQTTGSKVKLYDLTGKLMFEQYLQEQATVLNIQSLSSGTYLVELHQENKISVQRLIKD